MDKFKITGKSRIAGEVTISWLKKCRLATIGSDAIAK